MKKHCKKTTKQIKNKRLTHKTKKKQKTKKKILRTSLSLSLLSKTKKPNKKNQNDVRYDHILVSKNFVFLFFCFFFGFFFGGGVVFLGFLVFGLRYIGGGRSSGH